jgi:formyltetrahydrofolate-dependent phosphoribosylglycinamide formyltransferase
MLERLQKKWKVNGWRLALIIATFAIGGSLTGYAARKLMPFLGIETTWLWILIYILLVTLLWPVAVLLISIPLGQFSFFIKYIKKIGRRMGLGSSVKQGSNEMFHIAIFASGAGSNAQKIIDHFKKNTRISVSLIVCNNPSAGVLKIADKEGISTLLIEKERFFRGDAYIKELRSKNTDLIVLAGFLWKIPSQLIRAFPNRIINIHPALLPKYGGKGMYGDAVHKAVINAREKESGITIHYVDEVYDNGKIIYQATCPVLPGDTAETLAQRIHQLEHKNYPEVVEKFLTDLYSTGR